MKPSLLLLALPLIFGSAMAQVKTRSYTIDPLLAQRDRNVDFTSMKLEVALDCPKGLVKGKVTHNFKPLRQKVDSIFVDGIRMSVKKLTLNGKETRFRLDSLGITIYANPALGWETQNSMEITYECTPRKGLYFIGWNDPLNISRKQVWSQGQGIDNRNWIPMYDEMNDKIISQLVVTFDKEYKVLSNGTKVSEKDNKDGTKTWDYKMSHPHASYLIMLGIGKYDIIERKSKSGVPLHLYYYPEWKDRADITYKFSENMVDFFEAETGVKYGWESYSQIPVQDFMYGAMENTTATVFGDFFQVDERSFLDRYYIGVNAHELAHQWFGDLITARSDAHHWLQESFATYYNQMYEREVNGPDYFSYARREAQTKALEESEKNKLPVAHSASGSVRHYPQGAFVLNMLKYVVGGKEAYNKAIKYYLEKHKYQNVDSRDLLLAFEETSGMSLDWFWEQWVYKGGQPGYSVSYSEKDGATEFSVTQTQELSEITGLSVSGDNSKNSVATDPFVNASAESDYRAAGLFKMPVWFEVHYADGSTDKVQAWIERQHETVRVANASKKKIDYVLFDPNNEVMKSVSFNKPVDMLRAQALKAPNMLDRLDAVEAMRNFPAAAKYDLFTQVFAKETFQAVKSEIVSQLASDNNARSMAIIRSAINDKEVLVRKAVLANVKPVPAELLVDFEKLLKDPSYEAVVTTLDKLFIDNPSKMSTYLETTKGVNGTVGRNVECKWLELSVASASDKASLDKLIKYTSNSWEFRTRVNAMQALKRLDHFDKELLGNLLNAVPSANGRLAGPASEVLQYFYGQDKYKKQISDFVAAGKWERWQADAIKRIVD